MLSLNSCLIPIHLPIFHMKYINLMMIIPLLMTKYFCALILDMMLSDGVCPTYLLPVVNVIETRQCPHSVMKVV